MFCLHVPISPRWSRHLHVFTGTLEKVEGFSRVRHDTFLADTLNRGLADHYWTEDDVDTERFSEQVNSDPTPLNWKDGSLTMSEDVERLPFWCHCGTVSFELIRTRELKDREAEDWLVPSENRPMKYVGRHDVCIDCGQVAGDQIQSWIFVPQGTIVNPTLGNSSISLDPARDCLVWASTNPTLDDSGNYMGRVGRQCSIRREGHQSWISQQDWWTRASEERWLRIGYIGIIKLSIQAMPWATMAEY